MKKPSQIEYWWCKDKRGGNCGAPGWHDQQARFVGHYYILSHAKWYWAPIDWVFMRIPFTTFTRLFTRRRSGPLCYNHWLQNQEGLYAVWTKGGWVYVPSSLLYGERKPTITVSFGAAQWERVDENTRHLKR